MDGLVLTNIGADKVLAVCSDPRVHQIRMLVGNPGTGFITVTLDSLEEFLDWYGEGVLFHAVFTAYGGKHGVHYVARLEILGEDNNA